MLGYIKSKLCIAKKGWLLLYKIPNSIHKLVDIYLEQIGLPTIFNIKELKFVEKMYCQTVSLLEPQKVAIKQRSSKLKWG